MIIYHCRGCGWRSPLNIAMNPTCPECFSSLYFFSFKPEEVAAVNAVLLEDNQITEDEIDEEQAWRMQFS